MPEPSTTLTSQNPKPVRKVQKITQLLCLDQNIELKSIFIQWLSQSFKYLPNILGKVYLQLQLILNFIQYRFTVSEDKSQVGDYLQNIKYKQLSKKVKLLYLLMDVILPYLKRRVMILAEGVVEDWEGRLGRVGERGDGRLGERGDGRLGQHGDGRLVASEYQQYNQQNGQQQKHKKLSIFKLKILSLLKKFINLIAIFDKLYALGSFINLAIFIKNGKYRTLIQRILKMKMQFVNPQNSRVLNFTLMNRTMIWQIYEMVLKNILPYLYKFLGTGLKNIFYLHSYMGVQDKEDTSNCAVCGQTPTMTVKAEPCEHLYCFFCSKSVSQQKRYCKKCGQVIQNWESIYG